MKIGFIIQARIGSSRLPNKMAMPFGLEATLLGYIIKKIKTNFSQLILCVATSDNKEDDLIVKICDEYEVLCSRGDEKDVTSRFVNTAANLKLDYVIRVCGDNPFISVELTKKLIRTFNGDNIKADYYTYVVNNTMAILTDHGFFCEILSVSRLKEEWPIMTSYMKEHVTPVFYKNKHISISKTIYENNKIKKVRLTIDTLEDYYICSDVFKRLEGKEDIVPNLIKVINNHHSNEMMQQRKKNIK
ncbi:MAG TPA: hypothetical protein EYO58_08510 [Flavobacteriales bacterium]|nr:hypothetical protein [Flavobacteriales bacterium]